jgi:hypothetical protein
MMLLDAARLVDEPLEDSADRVGVQGRLRSTTQAIQKRALTRGIVDGNTAFAFVFADLDDEANTLVQEFENLLVDGVDTAAQLIEVELRCHS